MRSIATSKSLLSDQLGALGGRPARAASLTTLARSAPHHARGALASTRRFASSASFTLRTWTFRISSRPRRSGRSHHHLAGRSGPRQPAPGPAPRGGWWPAMIMTPGGGFEARPSRRGAGSRVCSRSSWVGHRGHAPARPGRSRSSSSMKHDAGGTLPRLASKRSAHPAARARGRRTSPRTRSRRARRRAHPPPPPRPWRGGSCPVPGGPRGGRLSGSRAPRAVYFWGFFRKSTTSTSSASGPRPPPPRPRR